MTRLIHLHILASGSKGNAAIVEGPEGSVLIDCGISRKQVLERSRALDVDTSRVVAVIITHEHSDHVRGLPVLSKHFDGPLFATAGTAHSRSGLASRPFSQVKASDEFDVAGMRVHTFPTSHDVRDPFGLHFAVLDDEGHELDSLGWCTDTGILTDRARRLLHDCRILGIESNHDRHMLATGPYPPYLQARVGGSHGHLSNDQAAEALPDLVTERTAEVVALHISENNNTPGLCLRTLAHALGAEPTAAGTREARTSDGSLRLRVASQTEPLTIW